MYHPILDDFSCPIAVLEHTQFSNEDTAKINVFAQWVSISCEEKSDQRVKWLDDTGTNYTYNDRQLIDELRTVKSYTSSDYRSINADIRNFFTHGDTLRHYSAEIINALSLMPSYSGTVYRGVPNNRHIDYQIGESYAWDQLVSCSVSPSVAHSFTDFYKHPQNVIFKITNAYGFILQACTEFNHELEVCLLPCTVQVKHIYLLTVMTADHFSYDHRIIECEMIPRGIAFNAATEYLRA